jgi:hypothetical protein
MSDRMSRIIAAGEEFRQYDIELGREWERERILNLLELEVSEWLSHDGTCDCKIRGEEGKRLIAIIKGDIKSSAHDFLVEEGDH